jgi:predicted RNase H-like HicB family nuclease
MQYALVIEHSPGSNFSAYVPDLPGCVSTGDSLEEVQRNISEAIAFHLRGMRDDGQVVPDPTTHVAYADVA